MYDNWNNDWPSFIHKIGECYSLGMNSDELNDCFGGKEVCWIGEVSSIELDEEYAPGIGFNMTPVKVSLPDGKVVRSNSVGILTEGTDRSVWADLCIGELVQFYASIGVKSPLAAIDLTVFPDDPEVVLGIRLYGKAWTRKVGT